MKERLIGAAVLVAAAVILIPEMLSGPKHASRAPAAGQPANASGEPPLKTYTIDLSQSSTSPSTAAAAAAPAPEVVEEAAPPPEDSSAENVVAPPEESAAEPAPATTESPAVIAAAPPSVAAPAPAPATETAAEPPQPVVLPPPPPAAGKGWAVQLGTFASQANAASVIKDMHGKGYEAFVMPVKSAKGTLYRVRIGPMKDREAAAEALRRVKASVPGAAVVAHP